MHDTLKLASLIKLCVLRRRTCNLAAANLDTCLLVPVQHDILGVPMVDRSLGKHVTA